MPRSIGLRLIEGNADPGAAAPRGQLRRDHAGVVDHQDIAGLQQIGQVADVAVIQATVRVRGTGVVPLKVAGSSPAMTWREQRYDVGEQLAVLHTGAAPHPSGGSDFGQFDPAAARNQTR